MNILLSIGIGVLIGFLSAQLSPLRDKGDTLLILSLGPTGMFLGASISFVSNIQSLSQVLVICTCTAFILSLFYVRDCNLRADTEINRIFYRGPSLM